MHILLYSVDVLIVGLQVRVCALIDICVHVHYMHIIHTCIHVHVSIVYIMHHDVYVLEHFRYILSFPLMKTRAY